MVALTADAVVLIHFPFSDLSRSKLRPAVVLADSGKGDWILCQVTSKAYADSKAVQLDKEDFMHGSLDIVSYTRPGKLFTANSELIVKKVGNLKEDAFQRVIEAVVQLLKGRD
ncbi:MAG: MazF family transcriptional regulator [Leptolyngbya foveolarum]|uniref:MazF family transcriptional regulator n=1 Tax=Leptolyngbya foveolarum TaxID=47253 RepID=A0A2W4WIV7_9CYAN|nr:MAG: MazF family transcriptional regulator [Leptolyngbya foveolarum]